MFVLVQFHLAQVRRHYKNNKIKMLLVSLWCHQTLWNLKWNGKNNLAVLTSYFMGLDYIYNSSHCARTGTRYQKNRIVEASFLKTLYVFYHYNIKCMKKKTNKWLNDWMPVCTCGIWPTHLLRASRFTGFITWSELLSTLLKLTPPKKVIQNWAKLQR